MIGRRTGGLDKYSPPPERSPRSSRTSRIGKRFDRAFSLGNRMESQSPGTMADWKAAKNLTVSISQMNNSCPECAQKAARTVALDTPMQGEFPAGEFR